jgi:uncharacterized protein YlxP (DUF503 family)
MFVIYGQAKLLMPYSSSLKDKRQTIQSIITRLRKRFSISVCEVDHHDLWQRSDIGFTAVCSTNRDIDLILQSIKNTLDYHEDICEITDFTYERITY